MASSGGGIGRSRVGHVGKASCGISLQTLAFYAAAVLIVKVWLAILLEYRWYFPPNFEASAFLIGRRELFTRLYAAAFYVHIFSGPVAIVLGSFLMLTGGRPALGRRHAWVGRLQVLIVTLLIAPSGLVMAYWAHAGALAGCGFALLAFATAICAVVAARRAMTRQFSSHRRWAARCFILLCSPLLLRMAMGCAIVLGLESERFYIFNAWLSWLIPLGIYELAQRSPLRTAGKTPLTDHLPTIS